MRRGLGELPAFGTAVEVHRFRWCMNDQNSSGTSLLEQRFHAHRDLAHSLGRTPAPMLIPHIGNYDGRFRGRKVLFEIGLGPGFAGPVGLNLFTQNQSHVGTRLSRQMIHRAERLQA